MKAVAYARVSTRDQDLNIQIEGITKFCGYRDIELMHLYAEKASGKNTDRPEFARMMHDLEVGAYGAQALIVYKLDRLGRSLSDLIRITEWLQERGIDLISPSDSIDTTTPNGRLFFHISGAFAEYERERILERTTIGRQAALEKGVKFGPKEKRIDRAKVERMIVQGIPKAEIARQLRVARNTLYLRMKAWAEEDMKSDGKKQDPEESYGAKVKSG